MIRDPRLRIGALPLSIVSHALLLLLLLHLRQTAVEVSQESPETLWVEVNPAKDDSKNIIVDSTRGEIVDQAEKDAYLSEKNKRVDRESIAKNKGLPVQPQTAPRTDTQSERSPTLSDLGVSMKKFLSPTKPMAPERPQWSDFSKQFGDAFPEYVKGVDEGEATALNTKEFVYYSYYKRIRDQLDQAWRPMLSDSLYRIFRSGRRLASEADMVTKTLVTLDKEGGIVRVQVLEESGIRDLDSAAVNAFNKAGPFPNPPTGLVNASGQITIRWDFILRS